MGLYRQPIRKTYTLIDAERDHTYRPPPHAEQKSYVQLLPRRLPSPPHPTIPRRTPRSTQADVTFPGGKKTKANGGAPLKTVAQKAGYKAAYGCEEGKCGTCEHKASLLKCYHIV